MHATYDMSFLVRYVTIQPRAFFDQYRPPKTSTRIPDPNPIKHLGTLWRSLRMLGLSPTMGRYYWGLVWWALRNNRRLVDHALLNAIMIYQLHSLYASYVDAQATGGQIAGSTHFVHATVEA